jgi:hypothetical protein
VISQTAIFGSVAATLVVGLLAGTGYAMQRNRRSTEPDVESYLRRLALVDREKIALVAEDFLREDDSHQQELESWQLWDLVGGMDGLEALNANCAVLIDLACHVQQWYPEALPVAEQLRLNAREIQWHLERLKGAQRRGNLRSAFPDYAQRAVAIYYSMTRHVLALYEATETPGLAELQASL